MFQVKLVPNNSALVPGDPFYGYLVQSRIHLSEITIKRVKRYNRVPVPKQYISLISIIKEQTPKFSLDTFLYSVTKSSKNDGVLLCPILSCFSNCENSCCIDANYETNVAVMKDSIAATFR